MEFEQIPFELKKQFWDSLSMHQKNTIIRLKDGMAADRYRVYIARRIAHYRAEIELKKASKDLNTWFD